jgi:hypothetical protein
MFWQQKALLFKKRVHRILVKLTHKSSFGDNLMIDLNNKKKFQKNGVA